jgi:hypothetical protein
MLVDIIQPQWIDFMQGFEFTAGVPPAVRELAEFFQFKQVNVYVVTFRLFTHHASMRFSLALRSEARPVIQVISHASNPLSI